jgi:hypothetical protein
MQFPKAFAVSVALGLSCGVEPTAPVASELVEAENTLINALPLPDDKFTSAVVWTTSNYKAGTTGFLCSGTVIGRRQLLTAAHCVSELKIEKRKDADGNEYETEVFYPRTDPLLSRENATIAISDDRKIPNNIQSPLFRKVGIRKVHIGSEWMNLASKKPEYFDFVLSGTPDVAIIETEQNLLEIFPKLDAAKVDVRRLQANDLMTLTGYGCEEATFDEKEGDTTNWGRKITAEYRRTRGMTVQQAAELESRQFEGYPLQQAKEDNTAISRGYFFIRGEQTRRGSVSLCPGDSGSGAFRGSNERLVIGINSGAEWRLGRRQKTLISWVSRLDKEVRWLASVLPAESMLTE